MDRPLTMNEAPCGQPGDGCRTTFTSLRYPTSGAAGKSSLTRRRWKRLVAPAAESSERERHQSNYQHAKAVCEVALIGLRIVARHKGREVVGGI